MFRFKFILGLNLYFSVIYWFKFIINIFHFFQNRDHEPSVKCCRVMFACWRTVFSNRTFKSDKYTLLSLRLRSKALKTQMNTSWGKCDAICRELYITQCKIYSRKQQERNVDYLEYTHNPFRVNKSRDHSHAYVIQTSDIEDSCLYLSEN